MPNISELLMRKKTDNGVRLPWAPGKTVPGASSSNQKTLPAFLRAPGGDASSEGALERYPISLTTSISQKQHRELLDMLFSMVSPSICIRQQLLTRYRRIAQDLAGYMRMEASSEDLAKRLANAESTAIPDQRYPLAYGPVEDMVTHVLTILFPPRRMYGSVEMDAENQSIASGFASVLNEHARLFNHYTHMSQMIQQAVVYNLGAIETDWSTFYGFLGNARQPNGAPGARSLLMEGNSVRHLDCWNLLLDYTAPIDNYGATAQFYATIENSSWFALRKAIHDKQLFARKSDANKLRQIVLRDGNYQLTSENLPYYEAGWASNFSLGGTSRVGSGLYERPVNIRPDGWFSDCGPNGCCGPNGSPGSSFNYNSFVGANGQNGLGGSDLDIACLHANERINITTRIIPSEWGLSASKEMEIWRFVIVNGCWIMRGERVAENHGILPIGLTTPATEYGPYSSLSYAERLLPFQNMMSNTFNLYIKGMRKNVNNGITLYDAKRVQLGEMKDPTSGWIPVVSTLDDLKHNRRVGDAVHTINDRPEINNSIRDIDQIKSMMQDVIPTDMLSRMADLDRAVDHQSKTVSNAASRRVFRLARIISEQAMTPANYTMTQNVYSFQREMTVIGGDGKQLTIQPGLFKEAGVQIAISDGLRGIDTISISNRIAEIIRYALQSRRVQSELDVIKLVKFLLEMEGAVLNLEQFKYDTPFDALDEQQKNIAFQLLQQQMQASGDPNAQPSNARKAKPSRQPSNLNAKGP